MVELQIGSLGNPSARSTSPREKLISQIVESLRSASPDRSRAPHTTKLQVSPLVARATPDLESLCIPAGAVWPPNIGTRSISEIFRSIVPPDMRDLAPAGMALPLDAGFNIDPRTDTVRFASELLDAATFWGVGGLEYRLFNRYLSGRGEPYVLPQRNSNHLLENLGSTSFMRTHHRQIEGAVREEIALTGRTSGRIRGVTDWVSTRDREYINSLGTFSGKLLYDVAYTVGADGGIRIEGQKSLVIQDIYDFSDESLSTPIPAFLTPPGFRQRSGFVDANGNLTDKSLAAIQREGWAVPFYVLGSSDKVAVSLHLRPR
jgi:hypothetical protein